VDHVVKLPMDVANNDDWLFDRNHVGFLPYNSNN
jgi:hypothetical protein